MHFKTHVRSTNVTHIGIEHTTNNRVFDSVHFTDKKKQIFDIWLMAIRIAVVKSYSNYSIFDERRTRIDYQIHFGQYLLLRIIV